MVLSMGCLKAEEPAPHSRGSLGHPNPILPLAGVLIGDGGGLCIWIPPCLASPGGTFFFFPV